MSSAMPISRRSDGWWFPDEGCDTGPFDTRHEAQEARHGLRRFYEREDEPGFVTSETQGRKRPRAETRSR